VQQRLIETGLILLRDEEHLVFVAVESLRQLAFLDTAVHAHFREILSRRVRVFHDAGVSVAPKKGAILAPSAPMVPPGFCKAPFSHIRRGSSERPGVF
jgi:hypothetical protein